MFTAMLCWHAMVRYSTYQNGGDNPAVGHFTAGSSPVESCNIPYQRLIVKIPKTSMEGLRTGCSVVVVAVLLLLLLIKVQSVDRSVDLTATTAPSDNANDSVPMTAGSIIRAPIRNSNRCPQGQRRQHGKCRVALWGKSPVVFGHIIKMDYSTNIQSATNTIFSEFTLNVYTVELYLHFPICIHGVVIN